MHTECISVSTQEANPVLILCCNPIVRGGTECWLHLKLLTNQPIQTVSAILLIIGKQNKFSIVLFMSQKVCIMDTVNCCQVKAVSFPGIHPLTSSKFGIFELWVAEDEVLEPISGAGDARSSRTALPPQPRRARC